MRRLPLPEGSHLLRGHRARVPGVVQDASSGEKLTMGGAGPPTHLCLRRQLAKPLTYCYGSQ